MSTLQIALVAAAVAALLVLVVVRAATRRRKADVRESEREMQASGVSFLDEAPQDTLADLGKVDPTAGSSAARSDFNARMDDLPRAASEPPLVASDDGDWLSLVAAPDDLGEVSLGLRTPGEAEPAPDAIETSESEVEWDPPAASTANLAGETLVPLSSIMVTTSTKIVDLDDPEVRRMLSDLVNLEIEQAVELRRQGLTVDAAMQLSEAEKIATALRLEEPTRHVREMIGELRGL